MKTTSINIFSHIVPCYNHCKYCLLSWNGKAIGVDYDRSEKYAESFYKWLKSNYPDISFVFYFGYSMDHPQLISKIPFLQKIGSPSGSFLQFDGMKMRAQEELEEFVYELKKAGIKSLNFTFYGTKEFHDKFAGRSGDYDLMIRYIDSALKNGLEVEIGIPAIKDNLEQLDSLVNYFEKKANRLFVFTPHSKGRGINLINQKITLCDYELLSNKVKMYFNRGINKTPSEWIQSNTKDDQYRVLNVSLTNDNIEHFENQSFDKTIEEIEKMDEEYYSVVPSFQQLLSEYVDEKDNRLYTKKDLYYVLQKRYIKDNNLDLNDINDERFCVSIRY